MEKDCLLINQSIPRKYSLLLTFLTWFDTVLAHIRIFDADPTLKDVSLEEK